MNRAVKTTWAPKLRMIPGRRKGRGVAGGERRCPAQVVGWMPQVSSRPRPWTQAQSWFGCTAAYFVGLLAETLGEEFKQCAGQNGLPT
jgi:hypothetical protein